MKRLVLNLANIFRFTLPFLDLSGWRFRDLYGEPSGAFCVLMRFCCRVRSVFATSAAICHSPVVESAAISPASRSSKGLKSFMPFAHKLTMNIELHRALHRRQWLRLQLECVLDVQLGTDLFDEGALGQHQANTEVDAVVVVNIGLIGETTLAPLIGGHDVGLIDPQPCLNRRENQNNILREIRHYDIQCVLIFRNWRMYALRLGNTCIASQFREAFND